MENSDLVIKVQDLQRVDLAPNDVLVVRLADNNANQERMRAAEQILTRIFPKNKVMIITKDTDVFVIAKQA